MPNYSDIRYVIAEAELTTGVNLPYATANSLPLAGNDKGNLAFVQETNRLYIWGGTGWYSIALVNQSPSTITGNNATYILSSNGTPTVVSLNSTDPEGIPLTWSYSVTSGTLGNTAVITQTSNVFTITPSVVSADAGDFTLTFTATDGINTETATSSFSLIFGPEPSGVLFTTVGQHTWTVPAGVTSVCVVCIGAGGGDDGVPEEGSAGAPPGDAQIVTSAHSWFKSTTHLIAQGGRSSYNGSSGGTAGGTLLTQGYSGGSSPSATSGLGGGGGAAGYGGNGGNGVLGSSVPPGGGGVGVYGGDPSAGGAGGGNGSTGSGLGVNGGTNGGAGQSGWNLVTPGEFGGGRGGNNRQGYPNRGGGGGALAYANNVAVTPGEQITIQVGDRRGGRGPSTRIYSLPGGMGAVRIIWGVGRAFPNTNADLASSTAGETTI